MWLAFPMVLREMQEAARQRSTFWVRLATASVALCVMLVVGLVTRLESPENRGEALLVALVLIAWAPAITSGLWLTADSISAEKRDGTLGLLFLTDLRSHDVVLGKLAVHLLRGWECLLALVPLMCLPLLMGGVAWQQVGRGALAVAMALFFSTSLGLGVSACFVKGRTTFVVTALVLALVTIGFPWLGEVLRTEGRGTRVEDWVEKGLICPSPAVALFQSTFSSSWDKYWWSIGWSLALGLAGCGVAWWRLPRGWQDAQGGFQKGSWREWWHRFWTGSQEWRRTFREQALAINPAYWLAARPRWEPWLAWFPLLMAALWWAYGLWEEGSDWLRNDVFYSTAFSLGIFYKLWFAWRAAQFLGEARREQTLELWLTAPIQVEQVIGGQWQALGRMFGKPLAAMVGVFLALGVLYLRERYSGDHYHWAYIVASEWGDADLMSFYYYGVVSLFDLAALGWLSMWLSLRLAHSHRAALLAIGLVMSLPWLVWLVVVMGLSSVRYEVGFLTNKIGGSEVFSLGVTGAYLAIHIGLALVWIVYGRGRLRRYFRLVAATPAGVRPRYREG